MKKILLTILFTTLVSAFGGQTAFGKNVTGPNVSAIYRIEAIARQLPPLPDKRRLSIQGPISEDAKTSFQRLFAINQNLALEVGRLPAFQEEQIKEKDALALACFIELVENAPTEEEGDLRSLLRIGLEEFRRYSSILEALLWILGEDAFQSSKPPLQIPLDELLGKAWDFSDKARWDDYQMVADRLNAPELVNYYQRIALGYESKKGKAESSVGDPQGLFAKKEGNCYDHSHFAAYCLGRAGYKTSIVGVHPSRPEFHVVCQYEAGGRGFYIDNGRPDRFLRRGIIPKEEYEMYHEKHNVEKGKATKDPVYLLQDNHGLALIYLMDKKERVTSVRAMAEALGISGYAEKVKDEYIPALIKNGFITNQKRFKSRVAEDFEYMINESLCERFKAERYHRPQNAVAKW